MSKGFAKEISKKKQMKKSNQINEPTGRLISWSPWPPANFKIRYPAFPFVMTVFIVLIGRYYIAISR